MKTPYVFNKEEHVHTYEGQPLVGTSTLIKDVMPPFLAKWGAQCAVDFIKEVSSHRKEETSHEYVEEVYQVSTSILEKAVNAWTKVRQKAADKGTDMHALLEEYVRSCIVNNNGIPLPQTSNGDITPVAQFAEWSQEYVRQFIACECNTFSKDQWVGGIVDCIAIMNDGQYAVIDFKSSKDAYFNHVAQVAGYALQVDESGYGDADGSNWMKLDQPIQALIVVPFGARTFKPLRVDNVAGFKDVFRHLVAVYGFLQAFNKSK